MPPKKTTRGQKKKQNVIPIDEDKISNPSSNFSSFTIIIKNYAIFLIFFLVPKENQEPEMDLNKKPSTKDEVKKGRILLTITNLQMMPINKLYHQIPKLWHQLSRLSRNAGV